MRAGNELTIRCVFLCSLASVWGMRCTLHQLKVMQGHASCSSGCCCCRYTIEQPISSIVEVFPVMKRLLQITEASRVVTWLGEFEAPSPKPIKLWTTSAWVKDLRRKRSCRPALKPSSSLVVKRGWQVTGVKAKLKESQTYPKAFGKAAARARKSSSLGPANGHARV